MSTAYRLLAEIADISAAPTVYDDVSAFTIACGGTVTVGTISQYSGAILRPRRAMIWHRDLTGTRIGVVT